MPLDHSNQPHPDGYRLRPARRDDLPALTEIEKAAGGLFAPYGLAETFTAITTPPEALQEGLERGGLWVVVEPGDDPDLAAPVGFALMSVVGSNAHLDELDVHPDHGRRGLGQLLVETVCRTARRRGFPAITLTTLRHIPWNAPFYAHLGFRILEPAELTPALRELLQSEIGRGLPGEDRVAMIRSLDAGPP